MRGGSIRQTLVGQILRQRSTKEGAQLDATVGYAILLSPILDPYARYLFAQKTGPADLAKYQDDYFGTAQAMQEGNPTRLAPRSLDMSLPPTLILQCTADQYVTPEMQENFAKLPGCWRYR